MVRGVIEEPEQQPVGRERSALRLILLVAFLVGLAVVASLFVLRPTSQRLVSSDWSGYSVASSLRNPQPQVTKISGSWTVPSVNVSMGDSFSAVWVGVGGQFDESLIQVGTEQDSMNRRARYSAWYELLPNGPVTINALSVLPGDVISASISLVDPTTNSWSIEIRDVSDGRSFQRTVVYYSSMLSGEWVVERPTIGNRVTNLADFGRVTFTSCTATVGGRVAAISDFPMTLFMMYNRQNAEFVAVSPLVSSGSSFSADYVG